MKFIKFTTIEGKLIYINPMGINSIDQIKATEETSLKIMLCLDNGTQYTTEEITNVFSQLDNL